jgi:acyl-CoA thioesterase FadM
MIFTYERFVEFADTDAAGIVHFTKIIQYMESAEHALLRSLGLSVMPLANRPTDSGADVMLHRDGPREEDRLSWPRVKVTAEYSGAAYFEDKLQIDVKVLRLGRSSVTYEFNVSRKQASAESSIPVASGSFTTVCCKVAHNKPLESVEIPASLREKLSRYLTSQST